MATTLSEETIWIADGGSTKAQWALMQAGRCVATATTIGVNPLLTDAASIATGMGAALLAHEAFAQSQPHHIYYYGAGCIHQGIDHMQQALLTLRSEATVHVASDMLGAARALCGQHDGIACILGTGSNSALYINGEIANQVSPLGYILGDEGSGAVLGKLLLNAILKRRWPANLLQAFDAAYGTTQAEVIQHVYREPAANRYLGSFTPFLAAHRHEPEVHRLLVEEFGRFIDHNLRHYQRPDLPLHFTGSIAHHFQAELVEAATERGFTVAQVLQAPLAGLCRYHAAT